MSGSDSLKQEEQYSEKHCETCGCSFIGHTKAKHCVPAEKPFRVAFVVQKRVKFILTLIMVACITIVEVVKLYTTSRTILL